MHRVQTYSDPVLVVATLTFLRAFLFYNSLLIGYIHGSRSTRSVDAKLRLRVHSLTIVSIIDIHVAVVVVTSLSAGRQSA